MNDEVEVDVCEQELEEGQRDNERKGVRERE